MNMKDEWSTVAIYQMRLKRCFAIRYENQENGSFALHVSVSVLPV